MKKQASCAVGYDGCTVWAAPRAVKAFNTQCNIIDLTRRSYTYETRLLKYSLRGFAVGVPNFERARVNPKIYTLKFNQVQVSEK